MCVCVCVCVCVCSVCVCVVCVCVCVRVCVHVCFILCCTCTSVAVAVSFHICVTIIIDAVFVYILLSKYFPMSILVISSTVAMADVGVSLCANNNIFTISSINLSCFYFKSVTNTYLNSILLYDGDVRFINQRVLGLDKATDK